MLAYPRIRTHSLKPNVSRALYKVQLCNHVIISLEWPGCINKDSSAQFNHIFKRIQFRYQMQTGVLMGRSALFWGSPLCRWRGCISHWQGPGAGEGRLSFLALSTVSDQTKVVRGVRKKIDFTLTLGGEWTTPHLN